MARHLPELEHGRLSDVGRRRLANEDAYHCDEHLPLFIVCDGIGGQPSGEAASQIIAHSLGHLIRRHLRRVEAIRPGLIEQVLTDSVVAIGDELFERAEQIPALQGMGATLVSAVFDARTAFITHAGDSRCYLLRSGMLKRITTDHTRSYRQYADEVAMTDKQADIKERRLLQSFVGAKDSAKVEVFVLALKPGDRLLLCSDGLTDPVDDIAIGQLLALGNDPNTTCRHLIEQANENGGPDNITAVVIDYKGVRPFESRQRLDMERKRSRPVIAKWFHKNLERIEHTLRWLRDGADEATHQERLRAMASVKRRLGGSVFRHFLEMNPGQNPAHVFHRAAASPDSKWRQQYEDIMKDLEPNFRDVTDGTIRLSPLLTAEETGHIISVLWEGWRKVEKRYFHTCNREAISESEATLNILIDHMVASVRTIMGLLEFFPLFAPPLDKPEDEQEDDGAEGANGEAHGDERASSSAGSISPV